MIFIVYVNIYEHTVVLIFVRLAYDFLDRSALFPPVEYHSLSRPLAGVLVPLVPVAACRSAFFPFVKHNSPLIPVPRVGNRPSVTRHRPNRRPRFFDVVSSRLGHRGRENRNRPSKICLKNSRPISSPRSKTDETNQFRVAQITVTGIATIMH